MQPGRTPKPSWLAPQFREEHRQALDLLNNLGGDRVRFFGIELRAIRIRLRAGAAAGTPGAAELLACPAVRGRTGRVAGERQAGAVSRVLVAIPRAGAGGAPGLDPCDQ